MNVLFCLLKSESSSTYIELCNKDALGPAIDWATKNDGRQMFFDIRDMVYKELRKYVANIIRKCNFFSVTLDKVTVCGESFTFIVSYFFHQGRIHWLLNSLHLMKSTELDGRGSAKMLVESLIYSLNMTKFEIGKKLHHVTYDGVYAHTDKRIKGGGSLSLVDNLETVLSLSYGTISGTWDSGHKMQLAQADILLKDCRYTKLVKRIYNLMGNFKDHKKGIQFKEKAEAMNHPVLTNKATPHAHAEFAET